MRGRRHLRTVLSSLTAVTVACVGAASPVVSQAQSPTPQARNAAPAVAGGPAWPSLTSQQRAALAPLQGEWHTIDASRKAKWIEIAGRYPKLPPAEQQRLQARMAEWSRLSPAERGQARLHYQEAKQLPAQERQAQWQAYQALPEGERKALATRARPDTGPPVAVRPGAKAPQPAGDARSKQNIVGTPSLTTPASKAVGPTVVQAAPGATTSLVTRQATPPPHQQAGMPKIAATPGFVDRTTLLPRRGPQGAATRAAGASQPKNP